MPMNVYECHKGICPKCGEKLPEHWKDDRAPAKVEDTSYVRVCPSCGQPLFCDIQHAKS